MARALQTLILAREEIRAPVFSSIEEYLGRNTESYYKVLGDVGQGRWNPQNDARPWLRYCLRAHYFQARTQLRRVQETERLYDACARIASRNSLPERTTGALTEVAYGLRLTHSTYKMIMEITAGETISGLTASRDLKALVDAKLVQPIGRTRGRYYVAEPVLLAERKRIQAGRAPRERSDPFEMATGQLRFDLT
jgi:Fic family protein